MQANLLTYFIEIERVFARHGTVEPRFQEARPSVAERMRSALVVLAHSTDPRVHRLKHKCDPLAHEQSASPSILRLFFTSLGDRLSLLTSIRLIILSFANGVDGKNGIPRRVKIFRETHERVHEYSNTRGCLKAATRNTSLNEPQCKVHS